MKKLLILAFLLICTPAFAQTYTVERVIDGDTFRLTNGKLVDLIGIDCMEIEENAKTQRDSEKMHRDVQTVIRMGKQAGKFVKSLIGPGEKVFLKFDTKKKDKYGNLQAYVYLYLCGPDCMIEVEDGVELAAMDEGTYCFLNATIIASGYALPERVPPNVTHAALFNKLYEEARRSGRGLWQ
ncbi:MAG TPA: thermonuclease family protein [Candidatus Bathyarchaeia archaeon]|nr:thermonuclease family protein [Candidatus Bathyarchaeia archaeon]